MQASVFDGLGAWVWILGRIPGTNGDPVKVAALAKQLGFKWLAFKSGERHLSEGCDQQGDEKRVRAMVQALHDAGLKCVTWHYGYDPRGMWHDEIRQIAQLQAWGVDGHILDMEQPWEFGGADEWAKTYCDALDAELPDFPISHAPVPVRDWHPAFPYDVFTQRLAARKQPGFVMPQAYWTETFKGQWRDMRDRFMTMWKKDVDAGLCRFIGCMYGQQPNPPMDKIPGRFDPQDLKAFLGSAGEHCSLYTLDSMEESAQHYLESQQARAPGEKVFYEVTGEGVRLRADCSTKSKILASAHKGEIVEHLIDVNDGFARVLYNGQRGWMSLEFLCAISEG